MRATAICAIALVLSSVLLIADDHSVIFDEDVDFSAFKTFAVRDARVTSDRPELKFPLVAKSLGEAVRAALVAAGLKETSDRADLVADCTVTAVDYGIGPFGRAHAIRPGQRGRGGVSGVQVDFTEATIVIDLKRGDAGALVWRGVYHDTENDAKKLAEALQKDASRLLSAYPPRKKK